VVYIAEHLQGQGLSVTVSPWLPGQLYVVSDSPRTIASFLPSSHKLSVKDYHRISDEEHVVVERSAIKFPNPSWVRVKSGKYKGAIAYVFDPDQLDLFVDTLVAAREFPYSMPSGSEALFDRSRLPKDQTVTDIIRNGETIGCSYKGQRYYGGLLLKKFHRYQLELVACPHADAVRLHLQSGFDTPFVKKSIVAFSMQFLRVGDAARIITGAVKSGIGTVVSIDHAFGGSARIELTLDGDQKELEARLEDMERVFWVGDAVRVVAGSYLGLEGHVIQMDEELFRVCQRVSMEEVNILLYY
jgi:ribosomal protein L24